MKKYIYSVLFIVTIFSTACTKKFLEEKKDWTGINEQAFESQELAQAYVDYIYRLFLPPDNNISMINYQQAANGAYNDHYARTTDEIASTSASNFAREWPAIAINQGHANEYFGQRMSSSISNNVWTRLKQINIFLAEIDKHGLTPEQTKTLRGEMHYWRGFQYFELLKLYGGVPLVLEPQNPITAGGESESLQVPRSSSTETLAQIIADLDKAIELLPGKWPAAGWGRITSGGAAAMKGRVLLTWASPLFNRNDDKVRWQQAYDANMAAKTLLESNGFTLFSNGGFTNGTAWENMWFQQENNPEAVIVYGFNNVTTDQTQRNNGWEQAARSKELLGGGSISPTKQVLDLFPMKDGKKISETGTYTYDPKKFYKNRDPRFYKTIVYNGATWPYQGNANFRQWTYTWHNAANAATPNRTTETAGANLTGMYVRKATSPSASNAVGSFEYSGTDYIELRFAEVIMNLAESAIGADRLTEGLDYLKLIRQRAGIENIDGAYGLSSVAGNRDDLFGAVIDERRIEFAFENKRFWDLRRWMLFNDDFGTCTRLKQTPLNGTRRKGIWVYVKNLDGTKYANNTNGVDPLKAGSNGTAPVVMREPATFPAGISNMDQYLDYLYDNVFEIIERDNVEPTSPANFTFKWYNEYYFFGLHQNILTGSPYLQQTQGWQDLFGAMGTFDPLK
ncbi:MAG TPA: RagB/SusD family nutrient uptake outer membrane protein [Niabella sp.]|nr:RagB/SusD family nutrient uptake outer membrane protein [Niabella sp.]